MALFKGMEFNELVLVLQKYIRDMLESKSDKSPIKC